MKERQSPSAEEAFASIKLEGARFEGADIPVDSLQEIIRYKTLIVAAAVEHWHQQNPNDEAPESLKNGLDLTLTEVVPGSAVPVLERPAGSDYEEEFEIGKDAVDQLLRNANTGKITKSAFPAWANIPEFWAFGSSLEASETLYVPAPVKGGAASAEVTPDSRRENIEPLKTEVRGERSETFEAVKGQVIALNAESCSFDITTPQNGQIHGRYRTADLTKSLREVIGSSTNAEVVLVLGRTGLKDGVLEKIHEAEFVVPTGSPYAGSAERLLELALLEDGWLDGAGNKLPPKLLRIGARVLAVLYRSDLRAPSLFPTEEGGLSLEWSSPEYVYNIEIENDGSIVAYSLNPGEPSGQETTIGDPEDLFPIITKWGALFNG